MDLERLWGTLPRRLAFSLVSTRESVNSNLQDFAQKCLRSFLFEEITERAELPACGSPRDHKRGSGP